MPAATSIFQIYNYAETIDRAEKAYLATWGVTAITPVATEDATDILLNPRLQIGPATGHLYKCPDGCYRFDLFQDCILELDLSTPRIVGAPTATLAAVYTLFGEITARIRAAHDFGQFHDAFNALLSYHALSRLQPLGTTTGFDANSGDDRATVRYKCFMGIRPDAWPADASAYAAPGS